MGPRSRRSENLPSALALEHLSSGLRVLCAGMGLPTGWLLQPMFIRPVLSQLRVCGGSYSMHVCFRASPCPGPLFLGQCQLPAALALYPRKAKAAFVGGHSLRGRTYHFHLLCEYTPPLCIPRLGTDPNLR